MEKKSQKNGTIELMRLVFTASVLFFHVCGALWDRKKVLFSIGDFDITFFRSGSIGVEFFFIVSGFLMAMAIYRKQEKGPPASIGEETVGFIWRKVLALWPYYLPACGMMFFLYLATTNTIKIDVILERLLSLFFLQETGVISETFIGPAWYISSMLIAMAVIYPFCRKYYQTYTTLVAPVLGILIVGALIYMTGNLAGGPDWALIVKKHNIRALAEISMGTTCFEVSRRMSERTFSIGTQLLLSLLAVLGYGSAILYACSTISRTYSGEVFYMLCVAITISFSRKGFLGEHGVFQNPVCWFLGSISLPLYLLQMFFIKLVPTLFPALSPGKQCLYICLFDLIAAVLMHLIVTAIKGMLRNRRRRQGKRIQERTENT